MEVTIWGPLKLLNQIGIWAFAIPASNCWGNQVCQRHSVSIVLQHESHRIIPGDLGARGSELLDLLLPLRNSLCDLWELLNGVGLDDLLHDRHGDREERGRDGTANTNVLRWTGCKWMFSQHLMDSISHAERVFFCSFQIFTTSRIMLHSALTSKLTKPSPQFLMISGNGPRFSDWNTWCWLQSHCTTVEIIKFHPILSQHSLNHW